MPISIGQVTLEGGQIAFVDRSIQPAYTAEINDLDGRVTGLSSVGGTTADVDLHGAINRSGGLTVAGKVNPLAKEIALDVQVGLKDIELPPASPYTAKYVGYQIGKGKLDLALAYKIGDRKLDAQNRLVLDQFTFGDKVDSPDALKLPVRLAVALLKDRRGVIDIDLPIAGSLDDPQFKVWGAVLKVLGNLVVKAVTAPFSLIASAFGGGDELSHIDFSAGGAVLDATAEKRLATLGKALRERPAISFEIEGGADPKVDRESLRRFLYERKLKASKMAALVAAGAAVASADDLKIEAGERGSLIEAAYKVETFPKPKNGLGLEKSLTPVEEEALMLANTRVEDDDLKALALRRATIVQSALAAPGSGGGQPAVPRHATPRRPGRPRRVQAQEGLTRARRPLGLGEAPLGRDRLQPIARLHGDHPAGVLGRQRARPVEPIELGGRELHLRGGQVVAQLVVVAGADDHAGGDALMKQPGEGQPRDRDLQLARHLAERVEHGVAARLVDRREVEARAAGPGGALLVAPELPAQKTTRQRAPDEEAHLLGLHQGDQLPFQIASDDRIVGLDGLEALEAVPLADAERLHEVPGGEVRGAEVADLTRAHQIVERAQRLVPGRQRVVAVDLIEVDVVGAEPPQAPLDRIHDVPAREAHVVGARRPRGRAPWSRPPPPCAARRAPGPGSPRRAPSSRCPPCRRS